MAHEDHNLQNNTISLDEKRCAQRTLVRRPVKMATLSSAMVSANDSDPDLGLDWKNAILIDLSSCGLGLLCNQTVQIGDYIMIDFSLPTYDAETTLRLKTQVTRATKVQFQYLIGVQILHLSPHEEIVIREFFKYHQRFVS